MLAVFEVINKDNDLLITGFLHDGLYLTVTNHADRRESKIAKITEAMTSYASSLGINITVEVEYL